MGAPIGQVFGAFFAGIFMERIGLKKSFAACNLLIIGCVFIQFFARSLAVLLVGEILAGLVLGCFVVIAPAYASEVAPLALRGPITASINLCFATGQLIANGTVDGTQKLSTHWAYSIPFSIQWLWPLIIIVGYPFAPERCGTFSPVIQKPLAKSFQSLVASATWTSRGSRKRSSSPVVF